MEKSEKSFWRNTVHIRESRAIFSAHEDAQAPSGQGGECIFIGVVVTQICREVLVRCFRKQHLHGVSFCSSGGTKLHTAVEGMKIELGHVPKRSPSCLRLAPKLLPLALGQSPPVKCKGGGLMLEKPVVERVLEPGPFMGEKVTQPWRKLRMIVATVRMQSLPAMGAPDFRTGVDAQQGKQIVDRPAADDDDASTRIAVERRENFAHPGVGESTIPLIDKRSECPVVIEHQQSLTAFAQIAEEAIQIHLRVQNAHHICILLPHALELHPVGVPVRECDHHREVFTQMTGEEEIVTDKGLGFHADICQNIPMVQQVPCTQRRTFRR